MSASARTRAISAQTGISGSTRIGAQVIMGGQVGIADHIQIADGVMIAAKSGVSGSVKTKMIVAGYPAPGDRRLAQEHGAGQEPG